MGLSIIILEFKYEIKKAQILEAYSLSIIILEFKCSIKFYFFIKNHFFKYYHIGI